MNEHHIARLEAQLERLVEGTFANLFGKKIRAQDIALQLARAMEDGLQPAHGDDPRPLAPDQYIIFMNEQVQARLLHNQPSLAQILGRHIIELATQAGYRLSNVPLVKVLADEKLEPHRLIVRAEFTNRPENSTAVMERVESRGSESAPRNPQLVVNGERAVQLNAPVINIGRGRDNQIILDDAYVSRHHIQLRLRFGVYMLFDVQSQGGTFVNDVRVKEHLLQPGDVIRVGRTRMVYIHDDTLSDSQENLTGTKDGSQQDSET